MTVKKDKYCANCKRFLVEPYGDSVETWCFLDSHVIYEPINEKCEKWERES